MANKWRSYLTGIDTEEEEKKKKEDGAGAPSSWADYLRSQIAEEETEPEAPVIEAKKIEPETLGGFETAKAKATGMFADRIGQTFGAEKEKQRKAEEEAQAAAIKKVSLFGGGDEAKNAATDLFRDRVLGTAGAEKEREKKEQAAAETAAPMRSAEEIRADLDEAKREYEESKKKSLRDEFFAWGGGIAGRTRTLEENDARNAELRGRIDSLEAEERRLVNAEKYAGLKNNPDFAEKSKARELSTEEGMSDPLYAYINGDKGAGMLLPAMDPLDPLHSRDDLVAENMTTDEVRTYNYLHATEGKDAADEYLDFLRPDLNARTMERVKDEVYAWTGQNAGTRVLGSAASVALNALKGVSYGGQLEDMLTTGRVDVNAPYNLTGAISSAIRENVTDTVERKWGKWGSFAYQTGMSMADFLFNAAISGGTEAMSLAIMGTGAAADATIAAKERGLGDTEAFILGSIAGAAEIASEKISFEKLFKNADLREAPVKYVLQNFFFEGAEEVESDVVNWLADAIVARDKSEWRADMDAYRKEHPGASDTKAFWSAMLKRLEEGGMDFLGGALSGGVMAGGRVALNQTTQRAQQNRDRSQAIEAVRAANNEARENAAPDLMKGIRQAQEQTAPVSPQEAAQTQAEPEGGIVLPTAKTAAGEADEGTEMRVGAEPETASPLKTAEETELDEQVAKARNVTEATGIRYGVDERTIRKAERIGRMIGKTIQFYEQGSKNGTAENGFVNPRTGEIYYNVNAKQALNFTLGHEFTHTVEGTEAYENLHALVLGRLAEEGIDVSERRARVRDTYERAGIGGMTNTEIDQEIVADWVGDHLSDERTIREICREDASVGKRIRDTIDDFLVRAGQMQGVVTAYEERKLRNAIGIYDKYLSRIAAETEQETAQEAQETPQSAQETEAGQTAAEAVRPAETQGTPVSERVRARMAEAQTAEPMGMADLEEGGEETPDEYLARMNRLYEDGEITAEEYDEAVELAEEMRDTGLGAGRTTVARDAGPEGKIPAALNRAFGRKMSVSGESGTREGVPAARSSDGEVLTEEMRGGTMVKYSLTSWNDTDKDAVMKNLTDSGFSWDQADAYIQNVNSIAAIIAGDRGRLDYEAADNQVFMKPNAEYVITLDASTLCAKRLTYQGTFDKIAHRLGNDVLMPEDLIDLANMMAEDGYQTPCGICYVESRRRNLSKFASEWLNTYEGAYKPKLDEVVTTDGLEQLRKTHPDTYTDFVTAMNKKGTMNPKVVQLRTDYRGDINKLTKGKIEKIKRIGGVRIQSFSDFETPHLIDMMQAVLDMSAKQLPAQAYTKVPNFAWVFGDTGIKINLSLIGGIDENGNLTFSSTEGMDFDEAMRLRERYSENVGTILVGMNDAHILAAMADPRIDFIIPFHRSGWSAEELKKMVSLQGFEDFTEYQNERIIVGPKRRTVLRKSEKGVSNWMEKNGDKYADVKVTKGEDGYTIEYTDGYESESFAKHKERTGEELDNFTPNGPEAYWDYNKSGKENAETYLKMCAEAGRLPKFYNFLVDNGDGSFSLQPDGSTDGYWKMLIDYKMYDNDGRGAPQRAVRPDFNMEEAERVLSEYQGGANELPSASDAFIDKYVKHYKEVHGEDEGKKYSVSEAEDEAEAREEAERRGIRFSESDSTDTEERQNDIDYIKAVLQNDETEKRRVLKDTAARRGYTVEAYHGTSRFGFTVPDVSYDDDKTSFFVTTDLGIAETYSGAEGTREITGKKRLSSADIKKELMDLTSAMDRAVGNAAFTKRPDVQEALQRFGDDLLSKKKTSSESFYKMYALIEKMFRDYIYEPPIDDALDYFEDLTAVERNRAEASHKWWNETEDGQTIGEILGKLSKNEFQNDEGRNGNYHFYVNPEGLYSVEGNYTTWNRIPFQDGSVKTTREYARIVKDMDAGYTGVWFKNLYDDGGWGEDIAPFGDVIVLFDPQHQAKSADLETYDDKGRIILPSRRYDPDQIDMRYSVSDEQEQGPIAAMPQAKLRDAALRAENRLAANLADIFGVSRNRTTDEYKAFKADVVRPIINAMLTGQAVDEDALFRERWSGSLTEGQNARADYDEAMADARQALGKLNMKSEEVRREAEAKALRNAEIDSQIPDTTEELIKMGQRFKDAKKRRAAVMARIVLTEEEQKIVDALASGRMTDEEAYARSPFGIDEILEAADAERQYRQAESVWNRYKSRLEERRIETADRVLENADKWKDKGSGLAYARETAERNFRDIAGEDAEQVIDTYLRPIHKAEAASTRFKNSYIKRVTDLGLSRKVGRGNTVSEAAAVQWLGEAEDNVRVLTKMRNKDAVRDGQTLDEWKSAIEKFRAENPNLDYDKVRRGIAEFQKIYGELITEMNRVLVENGYEPVNIRSGYFPHFNGGDDGVLAKFAHLLGINIDSNALPTSINGLTSGFKPGKTWFGHAQERTGFRTDYDAVQGFEGYIGGVSDVIHQTANLRNLRTLANRIRYKMGDDAIKNRINEILADDTLPQNEKDARIQDLTQNGRYKLSRAVTWLDEYTNLLANKKSVLDRGIESMIGRKWYTRIKNLEGRVAANMIAGNLGSALTNFIPLNQAAAMIGDQNLIKGAAQTVANLINRDGIVNRSDFLTNRRGTDPLIQNRADKIAEFLSAPMNIIDNFASETIVRGAYNYYRKGGMDEESALDAANEFAAGVMADRSKGALPTVFGSKNPFVKLLTQFQVEVNNEFSTIFKDIPKGVHIPDREKKNMVAVAAWTLLRYFIGAYLFNDLYESVVGRRAALDPIDILNDTVGDLTGKKLNNIVDMLSGEGILEEREPANPSDAITETGKNVLEELPFVGGLLGGGRIPISSALPDAETIVKGLSNENWSPSKKAQTVGRELGKTVGTYIIPPFAGGALKKAYQTAENTIAGGRFVKNAEGEDQIQYPYFTETPAETAGTVAKSLFFGPTATEGGREWVERGFGSQSAKNTALYREITGSGESQRASWDLILSLSGQDKQGKRETVAASGLTEEGKAYVMEQILNAGQSTEGTKFRAAYDNGVSADAWAALYGAMAQYDMNNNNQYTQAEIAEALENIRVPIGEDAGRTQGLFGGSTKDRALTNDEKAVLWSAYDPSWATKNNPYSPEIGERVVARYSVLKGE